MSAPSIEGYRFGTPRITFTTIKTTKTAISTRISRTIHIVKS